MEPQIIEHAQIFIVEEDPRIIADLVLSPDKYQLYAGDMVVMKNQSGYRSEGLYFFDGKKLVGQDRTCDDYGTVPAMFETIVDYHPGYWDLPDGNITAKNVKINVWYCSYGDKIIILPATIKDCKAYWHSNLGISVLRIGPNSRIKVLSSEKINVNGADLYTTVLSYCKEKYLFVCNFPFAEENRDVKIHVYCIINAITGSITNPHIIEALSHYKIPPERILVAVGV